MLIATLNHNLPQWTDNLVNQLKKDPLFSQCELMVIDNGSHEPLAQSTTHQLEENIFFGGGFNVVFHGPSFLTTSLKEAKESDASIYSPSVINASMEQCHWKQMWNWGEGLRKVKWIDLKPNPYQIEAISFLDFDLPEKIRTFIEQYADRKKIFESILLNKLEGFYSDLGWTLNLNPYKEMFFNL